MRLTKPILMALGTALAMAATPATAMTSPPEEPSSTGSTGSTGSSGGTEVPEPAGIAMFGFGLAGYGVALAARRRRKKN